MSRNWQALSEQVNMANNRLIEQAEALSADFDELLSAAREFVVALDSDDPCSVMAYRQLKFAVSKFDK